MDKVQFVTTTVTFANKGKEALMKEGINAVVRKATGGTATGCLYAIVTEHRVYEKAKKILLENNIRIISESRVPK